MDLMYSLDLICMLQNLITPFDIIFNALCLFNFLYNSLTQKKRRNINTFTHQLYFQIVLLFFQTYRNYRMRKRFFSSSCSFFLPLLPHAISFLCSCVYILGCLCTKQIRLLHFSTNFMLISKIKMSISFLLFSTIAIPLICVRISAFQFL